MTVIASMSESDRRLATRGAVVAAAVVALLVVFPSAYPLPVVLMGALLGTGTGLQAVGLVLTYRTTRIINFSYGAMGTLATSFGAGLHLGWGWPWLLAAPAAVVIGGLLGALIERLVIRRFREAPRLVLTVATIGLTQLLAGLALLVPSWFGLPLAVPGFDTPLSDITIRTKQVLFNGNDLILLLIVPGVLAGLIWFLLKREEGVAVRGMAENMARARLLGIPVQRLSLLLWTVTGALAALTVVLRTPNSGLGFEAAAGPAVLLPALAAAVVARFNSITGAFAAGVGLGVLDQVVQWNYADRREVTNLFFLGVIVLALLMRRRETSRALLADETGWKAVGVTSKLPARFAALPEIRIAKVVLVLALAAALVYIPMEGRVAQVNYVTISLIFALAALSLVVVTGWGGVVNLGQVALVGVGGLTASNLIADRNTDLFVVLGASAVAGGLVALVIGLPALRVTGHYLGVTTLAFAVVMEQYVVKPALHPDLFPSRFGRPELWGVVDLEDERWLYALVLCTLVVAAVLVHNLRRSRAGRVVIAARDNDRMAAAAGISSTEARLAAFVLAGTIAGVAGALHAVALQSVGEASYPSSASLLLFSMAVIGGSSSIGGTLAGVALVRWLGYLFPRYEILVTGVGLLVILMVLPGGLAQAFQQIRDRFAVLFAKLHGVPLAETLESKVGAQDELTARLETGHLGGTRHQRLLEAEGIEAAYGSFQVLFGVDVTVGRSEVVSLLGTNGAGKSTLLNSISGLLPARGGRVVFDGHDITRAPAEEIARLGLSLMPGGRGIFPTLSVAENLRLAGWMQRHNPDGAGDALDEALEMFPILRERWEQHAGDLSGGEQQQLSLAMAMATRPKLLCIDELSLGLAPAVVSQLTAKVREINERGTAVLVVEQAINVALEIAERAVFLEHGQVRFRGRASELLEHPEVLRAVFLGETPEHVTLTAPEDRPARGVDLEVRGLVKRFGGVRAVNDVDFTVRPGTIVGLIGHNGAGKTTIFDLIGGFLPSDGGRVLVGGQDITNWAPHRRAGADLGRSFQEARLFPSLTVTENLLVALETHLANRDPLAAALRLPASTVSERAARQRADEVIALLNLERFRDRPAAELSTGTRRIVELGCLLALDPAVVLLDEPSAGLAAPEAETLGPLLRTVQAETGCAIVVIEHNMALLASLCDEMVALDLGSVIATGAPAAVLADAGVISSYLGSEHASSR